MAVEKWRRRAVFSKSVTIRGNTQSQVPGAILGLINSYDGGAVGGTGVTAGTLALSVDGTSVAGTIGLLDMSGHRFRAPSRGALVGTSSVDFSNSAGCGGSEGQIRFGYDGASAQLGVIVGGTVFVLNWATAGGAVSAIASPAGAA